MGRSEAQRAADKKYREKHKGDFITWTTKFKFSEAEKIDAIIKSSEMSRAEFIRNAVKEYEEKKL